MLILCPRAAAAALCLMGQAALLPTGGCQPDGTGWMPAAKAAYAQVVALRFSEAQQQIRTAAAAAAPAPLVLLLEDYIDFLRAVVDDQEATTRYFHQQTERRVGAVGQMEASSPWVRYAEAEIRLHRAALLGRVGSYFSAAQEVRRACLLLEDNRRQYPRFALNHKSLAIVMVLLGALPDEFRWAAELLSGLKGSVSGGIAALEELLAEPSAEARLFEEEIRVALAFLRLNFLEDADGAWRALQVPSWNARRNPLAAYSLAVVAMRAGRTDEAIRLLEGSPEGGAYYPFWQRYYLLGLLKMNRLDTDADQPLRHFVRHFAGESGRWEACQKIAWYHLLQGDEAGYHTWMGRIRTTRRPRTEQDQAAWREARQGPMPNATLLRARLLFDGGYYQRAYDLLAQTQAAAFSGDEALEYIYRRARTAHGLKRWDEAEQYYQQTIAQGAQSPAYYACQAALQLGLLYENTRRYEQAKAAFQTCLRLKPSMYRISLHAKAKAGLARLEDKRR